MNGDGKGNLEINYGQHVYKCWACAETHGTHGHLGRLIDQYGKRKIKSFILWLVLMTLRRKQKEYQKLRLPKEYREVKNVNPKYPPRAQAYNYLKRRGITDEMIEKYDIGFALDGEYAGRIIVPSYDKNGELNYFVSQGVGINIQSLNIKTLLHQKNYLSLMKVVSIGSRTSIWLKGSLTGSLFQTQFHYWVSFYLICYGRLYMIMRKVVLSFVWMVMHGKMLRKYIIN
jgi:hypothetical protein